MKFKQILKSPLISLTYLTSLVVIVVFGALQFGFLAKAADSDLELYTEASLVSSPSWQRSVTLSDLTDEVKFKMNLKNLSDSLMEETGGGWQ